jgi:hypothetical protein
MRTIFLGIKLPKNKMNNHIRTHITDKRTHITDKRTHITDKRTHITDKRTLITDKRTHIADIHYVFCEYITIFNVYL